MTRLIIADDHPIVISGALAVLAGSAYQVAATAQDGNELLDLLPAQDPDMLVVDLNMPRRTGLDVLRILRARGDRRPLVLMMATIDNHSLREALDLGVNGVLLKQSAPSQLVACLDQVRRGQRWIDPVLFDQAMQATNETEAPDRLAVLSPRERAIARLVVDGLRNRDIGAQLDMTEGNVKVTLHRVYEKLGVGNRVELAMMARTLID